MSDDPVFDGEPFPGEPWDDSEPTSTCTSCGGEGRILTCPDDMCRGIGECVHGDGEIPCPNPFCEEDY